MSLIFPAAPADEREAAESLVTAMRRSLDDVPPPGAPSLLDRLCTELGVEEARYVALGIVYILRHPGFLSDVDLIRRLTTFVGDSKLVSTLHSDMIVAEAFIRLRSGTPRSSQHRLLCFMLLCALRHPFSLAQLDELQDVRENLPMLWLKAMSISQLHDIIPIKALELYQHKLIRGIDIASAMRSWVRDIPNATARNNFVDKMSKLPLGNEALTEITSWAARTGYANSVLPPLDDTRAFVVSTQSNPGLPPYTKLH
jgi:hypothetical protein